MILPGGHSERALLSSLSPCRGQQTSEKIWLFSTKLKSVLQGFVWKLVVITKLYNKFYWIFSSQLRPPTLVNCIYRNSVSDSVNKISWGRGSKIVEFTKAWVGEWCPLYGRKICFSPPLPSRESDRFWREISWRFFLQLEDFQLWLF